MVVTDLLKAYCELNACFAIINEYGNLVFRKLYKKTSSATEKKPVDEEITAYADLSFEEYTTRPINRIRFKYNKDQNSDYGFSTDRQSWYVSDNIIAIDNIPSSADGTDNPITGIYFLNPNEKGYPTKIKVAGFKLDNKEARFPLVFTDNIFKYVKNIEFINCDFKYFQVSAFKGCSSLTTVNLPDSLTSIDREAFANCASLTSINLPSSLTSISGNIFTYSWSLKEVTLGDNFNCNNLDLSYSALYTRETILQWLNALADRTGQIAYKLIIGAKNLAKLTEEDILIATNKNWTLA